MGTAKVASVPRRSRIAPDTYPVRGHLLSAAAGGVCPPRRALFPHLLTGCLPPRRGLPVSFCFTVLPGAAQAALWYPSGLVSRRPSPLVAWYDWSPAARQHMPNRAAQLPQVPVRRSSRPCRFTGHYREARVAPHGYGSTRASCLQLLYGRRVGHGSGDDAPCVPSAAGAIRTPNPSSAGSIWYRRFPR